MSFYVEEYVAADGNTLRYGKLVNPNPTQNRAMVFIPGLGGSVKGALNFLTTLLPHYSVIYGPDLRGFGLNPIQTPLFHIQSIIDDLLVFHDILAQQGHSGFDLSGISLGGSLSTLLLTEYKSRYAFDYQRYIALAPAYQAHATTFTTRYVLTNVLGRLFKGKHYTTRLPYGMAQITRNPEILNDPNYAEGLAMDLAIDFLLSLKALNKRALGATRKIQTPTLMFIPGADVICDAQAMRRGFNQIPAPKLCREYPGVFHDLLLEPEASEIAQEAFAWLSSGEANPVRRPDSDTAAAPVTSSQAQDLGNRV